MRNCLGCSKSSINHIIISIMSKGLTRAMCLAHFAFKMDRVPHMCAPRQWGTRENSPNFREEFKEAADVAHACLILTLVWVGGVVGK